MYVQTGSIDVVVVVKKQREIFLRPMYQFLKRRDNQMCVRVHNTFVCPSATRFDGLTACWGHFLDISI